MVASEVMVATLGDTLRSIDEVREVPESSRGRKRSRPHDLS